MPVSVKTLINLTLTALLILAIIVLYFKKKFNYWKNKNVYTERPQMLFGNAYGLVRQKKSHGEEFQRVYDAFKAKRLRYGGYYAFAKPIFVPIDLDLIKNILINDFEHFTDHIAYVNEEVEPIGVNLVTLKGSKWKSLRARLTPTFTSAKMKAMFSTLVDCSKGLCRAFEEQMEKTGTTNVKDIISRYTTDIIGSCIFGLDCNSLLNPKDPFRLAGKKFFDVSSSGSSLKHLITFLTPSLLDLFKIPLIDQEIKDIFTSIVKNNVDYREKHNVVRNDLLHQLIELKNMNAASTLTLDQLISQCFLFFLAGFETSSNTTIYCLYELSINTLLQKKLRREVKKCLTKHRDEITYDAIAEMTYMDQCIFETLRKYSVIPVHTRECTKTYQVPNSNVILEKGTYVMVPVLGIHRDPEYYPDPLKFDPERFSKGNQASRHPCASIPFGAGPRICIAQRFGMLQIKVCLSALLSKYSFTLNSKTENPLTFDSRSTIVLVPNGDVLLNIHELPE